MASKILAQEGIKLSPKKIRRMVTQISPSDLSSRVERVLGDKEDRPLKDQRVLLCVDGGRLRQRKNKRGRRARGSKRCGFHTDWIEPKLFTIYLIDEQGDIIKEVAPFTEIIDWTHAKQYLNKAFETLSKKQTEKIDLDHFKDLLFSGEVKKIVQEVKSLLKLRTTSKIMKKLKSYFVSNESRMQYATNRESNLPIGSGVIESAIRRVINMRVKSPGSF